MPHKRSGLAALASAVLVAVGASEWEAEIVAESLVDADERGVHSHGLMRLSRYAEAVSAGGIVPRAEMVWEQPRDAVALLDAERGFGQVAMHHATDRAAELASSTLGVGIAGVTRSTHYGAGATWGARLTASGCVGIIASTTGACAAPFGAAERLLGANPVTIAFPGDPDPIILDMATSATAYGAVLGAHREGRTIPEDWALDGDGRPTTDPRSALKGALRTFGGHKGSGLAVMVELLAGALIGGSFSHEIADIQVAPDAVMEAGHLVIAVDASFAGTEFAVRAASLAERVRDARPCDGAMSVEMPGDRELQHKQESQDRGIDLPRSIEEDLENLAEKYGFSLSKG